MTTADDRLAAREFVVAVREQHQGGASEKAFEARLALAEEYVEAGMLDEGIEALLGLAIDAGRLYGGSDTRTAVARLLLGDAYALAERPFDACGVYANLLHDIEAARPPTDPLAIRVRAITDAALLALEAEHGPLN